jgi:hypothetical protein
MTGLPDRQPDPPESLSPRGSRVFKSPRTIGKQR